MRLRGKGFVLWYMYLSENTRPADLRAALRTISKSTMDQEKLKSRANKGGAAKKAKSKADAKSVESKDEQEETYHFIGYVPSHGKVWELDGLKSGPLEVGELPSSASNEGWMDVARPALRMKMQKYGGGEDGDIRFSLLALVDDRYQAASDHLELLKRERRCLERRLEEAFPGEWQHQVGPCFFLGLQVMGMTVG
jgi:ubiquitin carboxyl-terminal hydrolase L5